MTVYLVGAGPGDPGLLTVRAAEVLAAADVVIYDRLSLDGLLALAPAGAERISVAKVPGGLSTPQDEINALLVERGRAGQAVVRLKGGDPFVFARGGEEAAALLAAEVPFEVVPGVTSAIAVPAYAGIPVTLRHSSTSFTVVTGHEDPTRPESSVNWEAVAQVGGTIVVLMGVGRIRAIADRLMAGGLSPDTPAASVQWGTRPEQRTIRATLGALADQPLASPSTIVIGEVAAQDLSWFESRPLFGKGVVVTRAREQASALVKALEWAGASTVELAAIEITEPADGGAALRAASAATAAGKYDWVVLTSVNGATRFLDELRDARALGGVSVAAIGPGTAGALAARNIVADLLPEEYVAESLLAAFPAPPSDRGGRVLLPRAAVARDVLPEGLRAAGWQVDVVEAYRTVTAAPTAAEREAAATADIITFTASSTVERYLEIKGDDPVPPLVACIGPVTADTARAHGLRVDVVAAEHTIPGLVAALAAHVAR
ncbi:MAG: uroporphyrinogen-III C-methyltransferase [Acidimicrobiales bacterium]|nr:uroporphyrinogen-III C-methyltransferase [Acidimicrobiales bacterium]